MRTFKKGTISSAAQVSFRAAGDAELLKLESSRPQTVCSGIYTYTYIYIYLFIFILFIYLYLYLNLYLFIYFYRVHIYIYIFIFIYLSLFIFIFMPFRGASIGAWPGPGHCSLTLAVPTSVAAGSSAPCLQSGV